MPSRPATSREALKTPEATPAWAVGVTPMTVAVSGIVMPLATPMTANAGISDRKDAPSPKKAIEPTATPMASIPKPVER